MRRVAAAGAAFVTLAGCNTDVTQHPTVIRRRPSIPSPTPASSRCRRSRTSTSPTRRLIDSTALYSNETWSGAVRNETNDIGRHVIVDTNVDLESAVLVPDADGHRHQRPGGEVLRTTPTFDTDIAVARSSIWSALASSSSASLLPGDLHVGPAPDARADAGLGDRALPAGDQRRGPRSRARSDEDPEPTRVGLARAYLQKGDNTNALATASSGAADVRITTVHTDDPQATRPAGQQRLHHVLGHHPDRGGLVSRARTTHVSPSPTRASTRRTARPGSSDRRSIPKLDPDTRRVGTRGTLHRRRGAAQDEWQRSAGARTDRRAPNRGRAGAVHRDGTRPPCSPSS